MGVQVARRFVGQNDRRLVDEGARKCNALLLASRKLGRAMMQAVRQAEQPGDPLEIRMIAVSISACDVLRDQNVRAGVQRGQKVESLEHESDLVLTHVGELDV